MAIDISRFAQSAASAAGKAASVAANAAKVGAETAAVVVAEGATIATDTAEMVRSEVNNRRYKPLFLDEYESDEFDRPKLIVISDEDERKGVEACDGAIGWMRRDLRPEVMHLYEEFVPSSGLSFVPRATCDAAYFVDPFEPTRYVNLSEYLAVARRDQITELKQIAHKLGAKECMLEYSEDTASFMKVNEKADFLRKFSGSSGKKGSPSFSADQSAQFEQKNQTRSKILFKQEFEGSVEPSEPELKWYKDDKELLDLIDTRLNEDSNTTKSYHVEISSFASLCMSASLAAKIDTSLGKAGLKGSFSLEGQYESEVAKKMIFQVVF